MVKKCIAKKLSLLVNMRKYPKLMRNIIKSYHVVKILRAIFSENGLKIREYMRKPDILNGEYMKTKFKKMKNWV